MFTPTPTQDMKAARPRRVAGFEIVGKLGSGSMGTVYKARQTSLDRYVALKVLPRRVAKDSLFIERFQREARASAKLNHPNIVQGIDGGLDSLTGQWYFAMEFVDGPSLGEMLRKKGAIPEKRALKIIRGVARGLACAQGKGIVHRDIKPDNIILTQSGEPKLADLGLAHQSRDDAHLTRSGIAVGTPHYMAPEQAAGESHKIDTRTDIYSLGATFYHMVTGHTPFQGETGSVIMTKHLMQKPVPAHRRNPQVSKRCGALIERMMSKRRSERFADPKKLLQALDELEEGKTSSVPEPKAVSAAKPPYRPPTRRGPALKRKPLRRRGTFVRKRINSIAAERPQPAASNVPVIVPPRVQRRPVEVREVNVSEPNQVKGFLLDLVVVFALGGLLAGGIYFYNTTGNHSWISPPPTTSVPSIVDDFSPPPLEAEPAKHAHDGTEAISVDDVVEKDLNRKPELILQDEAEVVMPVSTSENDESVGRDDKREDETLPSR